MKKNKLISLISNNFKKLDHVKTLVLVGSANNKKIFKNMDFLVLTNTLVPEKKTFKELEYFFFKKYKNCYSFKIDNVLINISLMTINEFDTHFNEALNGRAHLSYHNWCLGYFIPETFLADISESTIIFQKKPNFFDEYVKKVINYPINLDSLIINNCLIDLKEKELLFIKAIKTKDNIAILTAIIEIFSISFRALSAKKKVYYKGLFSNYETNFNEYPKIKKILIKLKTKKTNFGTMEYLMKDFLLEVKKILNK